MKRRRRATTPLARLAMSIILLPGAARGQEPPAEGALAEMLYRQGRALMAEGKVTEACPKFAESYQLDAATGSLLNLASCHEIEGKLASAWLEFARAVALARRDRRYDRVRFAQERLALIEPRLSYLTLVVPTESEVHGLEVRVDGVPVGSAARGVSTPVDPGDHRVDATAPGRKPWSQQVHISQVATAVSVPVPALEPITWGAPLPPDLSAAPAPTAPIPTSVYVASGVTLALAAAAGTTGYLYMDRRARLGAEQSEPELGHTRRLGAINVALDVGALVGAGVTVYLYFTRPRRLEGVTVAPWVSAGAAGVGLQGSL